MDSSGVLEIEEVVPYKFGYSSISIGYKMMCHRLSADDGS